MERTKQKRKALVACNGIAHIQFVVATDRWEATQKFYKKLCGELLGMKLIMHSDTIMYHVGARTGILAARYDEDGDLATNTAGKRFAQYDIGLHHYCFRLKSREDVDNAHDYLKDFFENETLHVDDPQQRPYLGKVLHGPQEDSWAPGYYSLLVEDPSGIRIEMNFVPGSGHLEENKKKNPREYPLRPAKL